jgi:hypothetical protein
MHLTVYEERTLHIIGMSSQDPNHREHILRQFFPALKSRQARLIGMHIIHAPEAEILALSAQLSADQLSKVSSLLTHVRKNIASHVFQNQEREMWFKRIQVASHSLAA